ncbi:MAG: DNA-binding protein [Acidobacteria bacterium RIFCSPLOWO2_02_FULL_67_36]|nr:MAG: DNA-binding protein [Acidobacteria bacterium RIFCSPLOWO2_02_FULL_67_36]OFW19140.1 MAG: DNA-binding protein [Acidobacteria bacterium RIFCSPLOWO2_12_FULL_66_21]
MRVEVKKELLRWARERAGFDLAALAKRFPQLPDWESGDARPTLKQLERFAKATYAPIGFLFLPEPPIEHVPIPDLRTVGNRHVERPSPDLLDTVYICQQRQEWYRDFARSEHEDPLSFVGSVALTTNVEAAAARIRTALGFDIDARRRMPTWTEALRHFIGQADAAGVLVMISGVVGSNNRRKLDPDEFRGFALSDDLAPLVFINGADSKSAQMFTLAHELAHIWLGQSALSDVGPASSPSNDVERWCNRVAAEMLVPLAALRQEYNRRAALSEEAKRLARLFKVSTLVVLRRIHDAGGLTRQELWQAYQDELTQLRETKKESGGDFYLTQAVRVSKRFARALIRSTFEGQTSFTEAFRMLGLKKMSTFRELGDSVGAGV